MKKHYDSTASVRALQTLFCYEFYSLMEEAQAPYIQALRKIIRENESRPVVTLVRIGVSYMVWGRDAIVVSKICAVKLRTMKRGTKIVAFDERRLPKHLRMLKEAEIAYEVYKANKKDVPCICQKRKQADSQYYKFAK
jgi:hypothetical protein